MPAKTISALALFSGGLDSILAAKLLMAQDLRVICLKFITPFFDYDLLERAGAHRDEMRERYGLEVELVDLGERYIDLLRHPAHGFGKHFNPCIDCKILMLRTARDLLPSFGASFLATGEVLGQRPMSQRRDTLRVIERDSGCEGLLLRPLCAKRLPPTPMEREGLVEREQLLGLTGRGRRAQRELAVRFGIDDYPMPTGGCVLTDPNLGRRIARLYAGELPLSPDNLRPADLRALLVGRQLRLGSGHWFILGRDERENGRIEGLAEPGDWLLRMESWPGPTGLLRGAAKNEGAAPHLSEAGRLAAALVVRYGRKSEGLNKVREVIIRVDGKVFSISTPALADQVFADWLF